MRLANQDRQHLPRPAVVHHHLERGVGSDEVPANLLQCAAGVRGVVNHAERVHEIVRRWLHELREPLGISLDERDAILKAEHLGTLPGQFQRAAREVDGCDACARTGEVHGLRAQAASNLEDSATRPARIVGKARNVRLDEVLSRLDLIKILSRSHWMPASVADCKGDCSSSRGRDRSRSH